MVPSHRSCARPSASARASGPNTKSFSQSSSTAASNARGAPCARGAVCAARAHWSKPPKPPKPGHPLPCPGRVVETWGGRGAQWAKVSAGWRVGSRRASCDAAECGVFAKSQSATHDFGATVFEALRWHPREWQSHVCSLPLPWISSGTRAVGFQIDRPERCGTGDKWPHEICGGTWGPTTCSDPLGVESGGSGVQIRVPPSKGPIPWAGRRYSPWRVASNLAKNLEVLIDFDWLSFARFEVLSSVSFRHRRSVGDSSHFVKVLSYFFMFCHQESAGSCRMP